MQCDWQSTSPGLHFFRHASTAAAAEEAAALAVLTEVGAAADVVDWAAAMAAKAPRARTEKRMLAVLGGYV